LSFVNRSPRGAVQSTSPLAEYVALTVVGVVSVTTCMLRFERDGVGRGDDLKGAVEIHVA